MDRNATESLSPLDTPLLTAVTRRGLHLPPRLLGKLACVQGDHFLMSPLGVFRVPGVPCASLGLHSRAQTFSGCSEQGLLLVVVCGFLVAVVSLIVEHSLYNQWMPWVPGRCAGLGNCSMWPQ